LLVFVVFLVFFSPRFLVLHKFTNEKKGSTGANPLYQNPALVSMIQGKLGTLIGRSSGYIESLPRPVQDRLTSLKSLQADYSQLELKFQEEILELEKKYLEIYRPLYQRRAEIVNGVSEPTSEELSKGREIEKKEKEDDESSAPKEEEDTASSTDTAGPKGIPEFWLTAMKNMIALADLITSKDEEALRHLEDIRLSYLDVPGFRIEFAFSENEFFTDKILTKSYFYQQEAGYGGDFIYDHAEGMDINWKDGKDLTVKIETKRQRNKSTSLVFFVSNAVDTNQTRIVKRSVPLDSFFNFFKPPVPRKEDDEDDEDEGDDDLDEKLELDYNIGEDIKEKLIPRAIDWYTGAALEYEEIDEDDLPADYDDEFSDDEDEDEDGDDDDDDEDEESDKPKVEPAGTSPNVDINFLTRVPECKQQ
jgi:nucleosome assembly protein 1-like 1